MSRRWPTTAMTPASCRRAVPRDQLRLQGMQKMEAVGRLAGGIAHDFNNLVQAIGGYSESCCRRACAPTIRAATRVDEILRAGERAAALTRQLLAFSRQQVMQPRVARPERGRRQRSRACCAG